MRHKRQTHRSSGRPKKESSAPKKILLSASVDTDIAGDKTVASKSDYRIAGFRRWQAGIIAVMGLLFFILYVLTTSKSVPAGDSGELVAAAWNLGVPHQPGYPTFTILGHIAGLIPFGNPAFRMNLLSALLDALALGVLGLGILRLLQAKSNNHHTNVEKWIPIVGVICGAGLLGVSKAFWHYSTVTEVFALNNLLSALAIVFMLEWVRNPGRKWFLWLSAFSVGLALTNQHTAVLLVPGLFATLVGGALSWRQKKKVSPAGQHLQEIGDGPVWPLRDVAIAAGFLAAGLLPYIYLPLAARADPPINIGDPSTFSNFWDVVTRSDYGTFSLEASGVQGDRSQQLSFLGRYFLQSFTPAGIILAFFGIIWFFRRGRLEGLGLGLFFLFGGPFFALFANPQLNDPLRLGVFERFYILPGIPLAFFIGAGAAFLFETTMRLTNKFRKETIPYAVILIGILAALGMLSGVGLVRYPSLAIYNNRVVEYYGQEVLEPLEPDPLLIMTGDYSFTSIAYSQLVLGLRTDVVAIHAELLKLPSYVAQQKRLHPGINIPFDQYDEGKRATLTDLVRSNLQHRPVYGVGSFKEDLKKSFDIAHWGLCYRFLNKGEAPDPYALMRPQLSRFTGFHFPDRVYPVTSWEARISRQYGLLAFNIAADLQSLRAQPDADSVERMYRIAIFNAPDWYGSYKNLGMLLWNNGGSNAEVVSLWEKYLKAVPDDPEGETIRKIITQLAP